jgi:hypothetical protein
MIPRRYRRPANKPPRIFNAWMSLAFLILALVMLLIMKNRLADSAASCYVNMAPEPQTDIRLKVPGDDETPNVRVVAPPEE